MQKDAPQLEIQARNLEVAYDRIVALNIEQLSIRGNIIAVIGNNGAGKSTFIKSLLGLLQPRRGTLHALLNQAESRTALEAARDMAFCPETGSVFADISVESYIKLWCRIKHHDGAYYRGPGKHLIELLDVAPLLSRLGRELSKGQRRRVQTAIGFLMNPRLFLFDEPFDGLDVQRTDQLAQLIRSYSGRMTFIISSHRMDVVERIADQVIVLERGGVYAADELAQVCERLAGKSFVIATRGDVNEIHSKLLQQFPTAIINALGSQFTLTSPLADITAITTCLGSNMIAVDQVRPSLVDGVNYYLSAHNRTHTQSFPQSCKY